MHNFTKAATAAAKAAKVSVVDEDVQSYRHSGLEFPLRSRLQRVGLVILIELQCNI